MRTREHIPRVVIFHRGIIGFGGEERLLFEEYKYFKKRDVKTRILTFNLRKEALGRYYDEIIDDIEIIEGKSLLQQILMLRKRLLEVNPDVLITACGWIFLFLATLFTKIPYVIHIHGLMFWFPRDLLKYALIHRRVFNDIRNTLEGHREFIPLKPNCSFKDRFLLELGATLDYLAVRKALKIIVLTERVRWEVSKLYGRDSIIARGCLDPTVFSYSLKEDIRRKLNLPNYVKIILSVSRLDPRKRIDVLIKAFTKLSKKVDNAVLVIVGIGPDEKRLKSLAKQSNCSDRVVFTGFVNDDELWDYYHACDVFACPGWTTSPITAYEALAFQKKVVWSSEASEPDEILNSPYVFIANPDPDSFADALRKALYANVETRMDLGNFTWNNYFKTVYDVVQCTLK